MKVYIVREKIVYHNADPDDLTRVFTDKTKAILEMVRMSNSAIREFEIDEDDPDFRGGFEGENVWFITPKEDYYDSWVEECEVEG